MMCPMCESEDCCGLNCPAIGDQRAGQQPSAEHLEIAKARLNEATNWHKLSPEHDEDNWCCQRERELRDEVMALQYAVPAQPPVSATSSKWTQDYIDGRESILKLVDGGFSRMTREQVLAKEPVSALREPDWDEIRDEALDSSSITVADVEEMIRIFKRHVAAALREGPETPDA